MVCRNVWYYFGMARRDNEIVVRVSPEQKTQIAYEAERAGVSMSAFMFQCYLQRKGKSSPSTSSTKTGAME